MMSEFLLKFNSNFNLRTVRARIYLECYVKEKRKFRFENTFVEKSGSSTNLK